MNIPDYDEITKLVGILIHMREPYDSHGARVASLAARMAAEMGMTPDEIKMIGIGAHLHDVGKLMIRVSILNATRKLSYSERAEMQNHPRLGWSVVSQAGYDTVVQDIVLLHHEKWNGTGYPNGLMGDLIPLPAQIVSICDVYEALTNIRPYRAAYTHEEAQALIRTLKNKDFNADLVDLFLEKVVPNG